MEVGNEAHADEDAQHDEGVGADAEPVFDIGRDEARGIGDSHALRGADREPLELVLDQPAVAIRHIGQLFYPCQVHRSVGLHSTAQRNSCQQFVPNRVHVDPYA